MPAGVLHLCKSDSASRSFSIRQHSLLASFFGGNWNIISVLASSLKTTTPS